MAKQSCRSSFITGPSIEEKAQKEHPSKQHVRQEDLESRWPLIGGAGRALVSAGFVNQCWQPSGYVLYNRPFMTNKTRQEDCMSMIALMGLLSQCDCA